MHEREIASWSRPQHGVDPGQRDRMPRTRLLPDRGVRALTELADPVLVNSIDFYKSQYEALNSTVECIVTRPGICHGWLGWFSAELGDTWFSTSPRAPRSHWSLAFLPLDPPLALEQGEPVGFQLARAPYGDWLWTTRAKAGAQRHSTLAAAPMKASTLRKAALDYRPELSEEGRAVAHVLALCDGARTMTEIAHSLQAFQPDRYRTPAEALRLVQTVAKQHA